MDYLEKNKASWNEKTKVHINSEFYDLISFKKGKNSLKQVELELLGDVTGKSILHLQCHFGQDSLSLARMGAHVTAVDFSDEAIQTAKELNLVMNLNATFICCDIYSLKEHLDTKFDIVFTSYGTIGWLPDVDKWAGIISHFLKPKGKFVFVEFHPVMWMFDNDFTKIEYNYFNTESILETETGTYADKNAPIINSTESWNHSLDEVLNAILNQNLRIKVFKEYNFSPYDCFKHCKKIAEDKYEIEHLGSKIPMLYSLVAEF
jgi:2-polyprenyl-3-methyl-5-hydroxy-6-metoxy-1,4-benzoquinol methylase